MQEKTSLSDLSLVVLNYNCEADTLYCVEKLLSFGSDFHIIVVDNQSPDGSYDRLKAQLGGRPCVDVLQSERNESDHSFGNLLHREQEFKPIIKTNN